MIGRALRTLLRWIGAPFRWLFSLLARLVRQFRAEGRLQKVGEQARRRPHVAGGRVRQLGRLRTYIMPNTPISNCICAPPSYNASDPDQMQTPLCSDGPLVLPADCVDRENNDYTCDPPCRMSTLMSR